MAKKIFIALSITSQPRTNPPVKFNMPKGCVGLCFAFSSIKAGKEFMGKDMQFATVETINKRNNK